jgi:hypothetical protein
MDSTPHIPHGVKIYRTSVKPKASGLEEHQKLAGGKTIGLLPFIRGLCVVAPDNFAVLPDINQVVADRMPGGIFLAFQILYKMLYARIVHGKHGNNEYRTRNLK